MDIRDLGQKPVKVTKGTEIHCKIKLFDNHQPDYAYVGC